MVRRHVDRLAEPEAKQDPALDPRIHIYRLPESDPQRHAARGHQVPGGILIGDAVVYDRLGRLLLSPLVKGIAADIAAVTPDRARVLEVGCGWGGMVVHATIEALRSLEEPEAVAAGDLPRDVMSMSDRIIIPVKPVIHEYRSQLATVATYEALRETFEAEGEEVPL